MRKSNTLVIAAIGVVLVACGSAPAAGNGEFPSAAYSSITSDGGGYRIEVRTAPGQPPQRGELEVELRIVDAAGSQADGLTLDVTPWMPSHGHGTSVVPTVAALGGGTYRVGQVELFMPGTWLLRIAITKDGHADSAAANVEVQ